MSTKDIDRNFKKKFQKKLKIYFQEIKKKINRSNNFYYMLSKKYNFSIPFKNLNRFKNFKTIAIIGMGGSILGSKAIYEIFKTKIKKKIYFFDNLDEHKIFSFKRDENFQKTLFIIISKSGNTIETLSNLFFLNILKKNKKNIIIITEKKNNTLFNLSKKLNLFFIEHKNYIGGRFSVLSEVGMVPAYLMGINVNKIRKNINRNLIINNKSLKDGSLIIASLLNKKKFTNLIFLNYVPKLENLLFWCQQLIGESLGKNGKGLLPIVSNVPKDHHSLLQLYLDGPRDKIFYVISMKNKIKKNFLKMRNLPNKNNYLHKKSLHQIKEAQKNAMILSLNKNNIPLREFEINNCEETIIGELFAYFILETIITGKLSSINPFDQPAVEQVKKNTLKMLN